MMYPRGYPSPPVYTSQVPLEQALMGLARSWADARSKSPRSRVGAVVYCLETGMMAFGYNGLPKGMPDEKATWDNTNPEDPCNLYSLVQHAEMNAIRKAWQHGIDCTKSILCVTMLPCHHCMKDFVVPSGIKLVWFQDYPRNHDPKLYAATEYLARANRVELRKL